MTHAFSYAPVFLLVLKLFKLIFLLHQITGWYWLKQQPEQIGLDSPSNIFGFVSFHFRNVLLFRFTRAFFLFLFPIIPLDFMFTAIVSIMQHKIMDVIVILVDATQIISLFNFRAP